MAESLDPTDCTVDPNERAGDEDVVSVRCSDESVADREHADRVTAIAGALAEMGVRTGERVLVLLPDGPGFVEAFLGVMHQGAVPLPVNPLLSAADVAAIGADVDARLALASSDRIRALASLEAELLLVDGPEGTWVAVLRLH